MLQRKIRRFRHRSNGRGHQRHGDGDNQPRMRSNLFSSDERRNNFRPTQSAEKLFQKYNDLATEAKTSGDVTASENYYQHADHYSRIIEDKKKYQNQNKTSISDDKKDTNQVPLRNAELNQNKTSISDDKKDTNQVPLQNTELNQNQISKEKK